MMKKCTTTDTSTIHTKYDIHGFHPTYETETTTELDHPIGEQIPYCKYWETVRKVPNGYEPTFVLGNQQWSLQNTLGEPGILTDFKSTEGIDECDWWLWNS